MRPRNLLILAVAVSLRFTNPSSAQPPSGFTIAGVVVRAGSNQPLRHARVSLAPVADRQRQFSVLTSNAGEFSFSGLLKGKYALEVESHGTVQGFLENEQFSTAIVVGPGCNSEHIVFPLEDAAAISGSVVDDEGDPVREAQVFLFHRGVFYGSPKISMQQEMTTGASGQFRFRHLRAGTYFVAAQGMPWFAQHVPRTEPREADQSSNQSELDVTYPVTYHADSTDPAGASPVILATGSAAEIRITLRAVPALYVRFEDIPSQPERNIQPQLSQVGLGGILLPAFAQSITVNHQTEIMGVAPGSYVLNFQHIPQGQAQWEVLGVAAVTLAADAALEASQLSKTRITGRVLIEDKDERSPSLSISLTDIINEQGVGTLVKPGGTFDYDNGVLPGRYHIGLSQTDFYIKSIVVKGAEYSRGILTVPDGAAVQLSIIAATGRANVDGIALKDGKPVAGAMVLAIPEDPSRGDIPRDQSDSDGTFTLPSVPPGRYTVVIDEGRDLPYQQAPVIAPYVRQAKIVDVPLRGGTALQVEVQHRQP